MVTLILAGGDLVPTLQTRELANQAELIIAADSGIRHAKTLGLTPNFIVGDFDSATEEDLLAFQAIKRETHPVDKNFLDLELAIEKAIALATTKLFIFGATGDRLDQSLAAIMIISQYTHLKASLHSGNHSAYFLKGPSNQEYKLPQDTTFSIISLEKSSSISLGNAVYELNDFRLDFGVGLGVSNRVSQSPLSVQIDEGLIALIVEHNV